MQKSICLIGLLLFVFFPQIFAYSQITYGVILSIVITELIFAFSVGLICVVFSFNLLRTVKETSNNELDNLAAGEFPPSRASNPNFLRSRGNSLSQPIDNLPNGQVTNPLHDYSTFPGEQGPRLSTGSEFDVETPLPGYQIDLQQRFIQNQGHPPNQSYTVWGLVENFFSYLR